MKRIFSLLLAGTLVITLSGQTLHNVCISEVASAGACGASATGIFVPASLTISVGDSIEFETYLVALSGYNGTHNIRFNGGSPYDVNLPISTNALAPKTTVRTPAFKTAGTYTMECTNSNHCQIAQLMQSWNCTGYSVTVVGPTGIEHAPAKPEVHVWPNPAKDVVNIKAEVKAANIHLEVYNIVGKRVYHSSHIANTSFSLNTSDYPAGIYILKVVGNGQTTVKQFSVK